MRENCTSGSEGGESGDRTSPTPIGKHVRLQRMSKVNPQSHSKFTICHLGDG